MFALNVSTMHFPLTRMHSLGGAVQQVTLRQVMPKLVTWKLMKERVRDW